MDTPGAVATFELAATVGAGQVAVAPGRLLRQTLGRCGNRTFHFRLAAPAPPCHMALAVGALLESWNSEGHSPAHIIESVTL